MNKVPAYRYDIFINAFEKKVSEYQQKIRKLERMERLYNIVREAGEMFRLPNDQKLYFDEFQVNLRIYATSDDTLKTFDDLADLIGAKLHEAGLHRDGVPSKRLGSGMAWYKFYVNTKPSSSARQIRQDLLTIYIGVDVPIEGMRDIDVKHELRTYTIDEITMSKRETLRPIGWRGAQERNAEKT